MKYLLILMTLLFSSAYAADEEEAPKKQLSYVSLGEAMVLNLSTNSRRLTFLQLKADVLVEDDEAKEAVEAHIPAIRHKVIVILSEQKATDMKQPTKREEIRKHITEEVKLLMDELAGNDDIDEILFSSFLIQ